jgi:hypothetical protein
MPLLSLYATMECRWKNLLFSNKDKMYYILRPKKKGTRKYNKNACKTLQNFSSSLSIIRITRSRRMG